MSETAFVQDLENATQNQVNTSRLTLRWALKRAAIGILILTFFIGGTAWLLHASIDQEPSDLGASKIGATTSSTDVLPIMPSPVALHKN